MRLMVLDLTRLLPGGYATHLLREMGARVIKVEDPQRGDYMREFPFPLEDGMSAYFHAINRGKESVAIDLKKSPEILLDLVQHADVLIEGFRPGVMERLGAGYDVLSRQKPRLIYCSLIGYPSYGDYRDRAGHDINYVGSTGLLEINRGQDGKPAMPGFQISDVAAGAVFAVVRILQSVIERSETGQGRHIEVDMVTGTAALMGFMAAPAALAGKTVSWTDLLLNGQVACYNLYPTADGRWMTMGNVEAKFWRTFCSAVNREDWIPEQFNRTPEFRAVVSDLFRTKTQAEWAEVFRNVDTCIEPLATLNEAAARGLFQYPNEPAPRLGEHTEQVLQEFNLQEPRSGDIPTSHRL
jgi:crotonobetainyl-CoA:carnitine CoA-transferase CaiB-like acyl-CoA transferase